MQRPVLFYDGSCPLCSREIAHYQRLDRAGRVDWVNIAAHPERLDPYSIDFDDAMRRLHLVDQEGGVKSGAYAFNVLWAQLPYYHLLAVLTRPGLVLRLMDGAYDRFAAWRLRRRQCAVN